MKNKIVILVLVILIISLGLFFFFYNKSAKSEIGVPFEEEVLLNENVNTVKEVKLYSIDGEGYEVVGMVGKGVMLHIGEYNDGYYKVYDLGNDYYVKKDNLVNIEDIVTYDNRYKNYILFNNNVNTKNNTSLYDDDGNLIYKFNIGMSFPIIIKDDNKYGVEFNNRLLYVMGDELEVVDNHNTLLHNTNGIGVLNYHFFYDDSIASERSDCNQVICASKTQFKSHLDYIKDNNFFTPTMAELEMYIDGKIRLPKSVVITIDDSWRAELGIEMLTEYKLNGVMFLVTSWANPNNYRTEYVEVHSHSDNMHNLGDCPVGQGGGIQCLDEEVILNDLKTSSEKLNGSTVFCYPYYEYNNYSIEMLKKAGYTMAFAGESRYSDNLVKVGSDKYRLPRFVIVNYTTMDDLINYLNG